MSVGVTDACVWGFCLDDWVGRCILWLEVNVAFLWVWHTLFFNCLIIRVMSNGSVPDPPFKAGVWHGVFCEILIMSALPFGVCQILKQTPTVVMDASH